jgi:hypothetical protein
MVVRVGATSATSATVEPPPQEPGPGLGGFIKIAENGIDLRFAVSQWGPTFGKPGAERSLYAFV